MDSNPELEMRPLSMMWLDVENHLLRRGASEKHLAFFKPLWYAGARAALDILDVSQQSPEILSQEYMTHCMQKEIRDLLNEAVSETITREALTKASKT